MMDAQELLDWQVLEQIDPYGQARDDARFAMLASVVVNAAGAKKRDGSAWSVKDFMLGDLFNTETAADSQKPMQDAKTIEAMFRAMVAANNALWSKRERIRQTHTVRTRVINLKPDE